MTTPVEPHPSHCKNCGAELLGPHCHACGQPVKGLVRHFSSIIGDVMDTLFEYDGRLWRTLGPLMFRPGWITAEYLAGRRVSFVSPFRLVFFITVIAFLAAQLTLGFDENDDTLANEFNAGVAAGMAADEASAGATMGIAATRTSEQLDLALQQQIEAISQARQEIRNTESLAGAAILESLNVAEQQLREQAQSHRLRIESGELQPETEIDRPSEPLTQANNTPSREQQREPVQLHFNGEPWHPVSNPLTFDWLPEMANQRINRTIGRAQSNIERIRGEPNLLKDAFLSSLPLMLFLMLPVFALLLKVLYLFKRRLYMEHLIVGMHSHAFLSASLLLLVLLNALGRAAANVTWLEATTGVLATLLALWMPLYLLLMQKKIYRQGWIMTVVKYLIIGGCYMVMLIMGMTLTLMFSVASM